MYVVQQMHESDPERTWIAVTEQAAKDKAWEHFSDECLPDEWVEEVLGDRTREDLDATWGNSLAQYGQVNLTCDEGHGITVYVDVEVLE